MTSHIADSSVWIAILTGEPGSERYLPLLSSSTDLLVPAIVVYEVVRWSLVHLGEKPAQAARLQLDRYRLIETGADIAAHAAHLAVRHRLAMADAMILATARDLDAELWTQDADFAALPSVRLFAKL